MCIRDRIYIEPLLPEVVKRIMESEKPDALLAGMGGQTALNIASALAKDGTLDELGVELIGCNLAAIDEAEDRDLFKRVCEEIGLPVCKAMALHTGRPISSQTLLKRSRSSASSIAARLQPISSTPNSSRVPSLARADAMFRAV